jgi:uncharacterized Ntn-hydrolase superfamily protein
VDATPETARFRPILAWEPVGGEEEVHVNLSQRIGVAVAAGLLTIGLALPHAQATSSAMNAQEKANLQHVLN